MGWQAGRTWVAGGGRVALSAGQDADRRQQKAFAALWRAGGLLHC